MRLDYIVFYFERFSLEISLSIEVTGAGISHIAKKMIPPNNVKEIKIKTINADFIARSDELQSSISIIAVYKYTNQTESSLFFDDACML